MENQDNLPEGAKPPFRWADVPKAERPYKNYVEEYLRAPDCPRTDELVERWAGIAGSVEIGIYVRAPGVEHEREQMQRELYPDRPEPGSPESIAQLRRRADELFAQRMAEAVERERASKRK